MTAEEFIASLFLSNIGTYILSVLICGGLVFFQLRNKIRSIFDPMLISLIGFAFACSIAVFLFLCDEIPSHLFIYFCLCSFTLILLFRKNIPNRNIKIVNNKKIIDYKYYHFLFVFCMIVYLFTSLYSMYINGIPLFNDNRFAQNIDNGAGILGILERFKSTTNLYIVFYSFFLIRYKSKLRGVSLLLILVTIGFLGGAKGFVLSFVSGYFFYSNLYEGRNPSINVKYIPFIVLTPILTIVIGGLASSGVDSFIYFGYRFLAYGDIYWNAYPNDIIGTINYSSPLLNMTYMFWGPFRHIFGVSVQEYMMTTGGSLLFEQNYNYFPIAGAPNSPITVMSWIYYKWYGLILVILIGYFCSFFYYNSFKKSRRTLPNCCLRAMVCMTCLSCVSDIYLVFNSLFNLLLFYIIIVFLKIVYNLNCRNYAI